MIILTMCILSPVFS